MIKKHEIQIGKQGICIYKCKKYQYSFLGCTGIFLVGEIPTPLLYSNFGESSNETTISVKFSMEIQKY